MAAAGTSARDARLVRRAALVVTAQTVAAVALVVTIVAITALALTQHTQRTAAERLVRTAALSARSVDQPPAGVVLLIRDDAGLVSVSPGTPPPLASIEITSLPAGLSTANIALEADDPQETTPFQLYAADRGGERVVAALDVGYQAEETHRLIMSLLIAGGAGIAAAALLSWLVGTGAVRPLQRALALQRRFVTDASHELRTPLSIVHTRAQMLQRRPGLDDVTRAGLAQLVADTHVLSDIVTDLLLSADLEHRPQMHEIVDMGVLAQDVVASMSIAAETGGVDLIARTPDSPVLVRGVPAALRRAVNSLVDNAIGHSSAGGSVTVAVAMRGPRTTITVADTGEGMDPHEGPRLLARFARAEKETGRGRGFGLGLALVNEVVRTHGGTFELTGAPGAGATATINLPLAAADT